MVRRKIDHLSGRHLQPAQPTVEDDFVAENNIECKAATQIRGHRHPHVCVATRP